MKKGILAVIAILILLMIAVLIWNANQQAGNVNGNDVGVVDPTDDDNDEAPSDNEDDADNLDPGNDTTDGTGIDDEPMVSDQANIKVMLPDDGQKVGVTGMVIVGDARVYENNVNWRVKDASGAVLDSGFATADAPDIGQFGSFVAYADYVATAGQAGVVEVYTLSANDGSEIELVSIPVRFVAEREVPVYFGYAVTSGTDCSVVHGAPRMIPAGVSRRYAMASAIWELLRGATDEESDDNFASHVPQGVKLNSLKITGNTVAVDFSSEIEGGGSCRVTAIRAQIEDTLKQFDGITNVVISVDGGNPEEALQP